MAMAMATAGSAGRRTASGRLYQSDPEEWGAWVHQGHRLWANMSDAFWVYVYKVQRCPKAGAHDWMTCPYAHRGERARRRDPRRVPYLPIACPDFRASQQYQALYGTGGAPTCIRGFHCRYAHGVFELWLHPGRFRTRMCDAGTWCTRAICFFAHYYAQRRREDDRVPLLDIPPPPRIIPPPTAPLSFARQRDQMIQSMPDKVRLYGASSSSASSSAAVPVATPAPPLVLASPRDEDAAGTSGRGADEYFLFDDFPYFDLINMVME